MPRTSLRWKPPGAITITDKQKLGVVYLYRNANGQRAAVGYAGKASRSAFHFTYSDDETVTRRVETFFRDLIEYQRTHPSADIAHIFKVGNIVSYSSLQQQMNVEWFRVVRVSRHYVWLQPICGEIRPTDNLGGDSTPHVNTASSDPSEWGFTDRETPVEKHRASGGSITMEHGCAVKWEGAPLYASWQA